MFLTGKSNSLKTKIIMVNSKLLQTYSPWKAVKKLVTVKNIKKQNKTEIFWELFG